MVSTESSLGVLNGVSVVYFIQSACPNRFIKIGVSDDTRNRIAALQSASPYPLKLLHEIPGGVAEERAMHIRFGYLHFRGEWFYPGDKLLEFIGLSNPYRSLMRRRHARTPVQGVLPLKLVAPEMTQDEIFRQIAAMDM